MTRPRNLFVFLFAASLWLGLATNAHAQLDRVFDKEGNNVSGAVSQTSARGVQLSKAGATQNISAGDILKILYEGDPPPLTRGRELALKGEYAKALGELKNVAIAGLPRDVMKADAAFYTVLCQARLALAGKGNKEEASKQTLAFAGRFKDSWHFFDAARLLGDLELALGNNDQALKYYGYLANAPSSDTKIEAVYLQGLVYLKQADSAAAMAQFDKILSLKAQTTETARIQNLAKAGKAVGLAFSGDSQKGLSLINGLIAELDPADVELAARIYNAQGAGYEAAGDDEGAVMAYLHTHLMFSAQPDAHAEALKRLVELWPKIGKPERAAAARQELKQRYPGF